MVELQDINKQISKTESSFLIVAGIPAYNEEKTIAKVVLSAQEHAHIVIVCDDGSGDSTATIAERLGAVVIRHSQNHGYGAALNSLFERARELKADVLITLDSDGQHDPAEIPRLVKPIEDGVADVVLGSRFIDKNGTADMPAYRQFGIKVITKLSNGSSKNAVSDSQSGFRAYNKHAIQQLGCISDSGMSASLELIRSIRTCGLNLCEVPVSCKYSEVGAETSTEHPISHGVGLVMSLVRLVVEERPITYLGIPGIVAIGLGTLFGLWLMNLYVDEGRIVTNVALASIGFLLIGFFMVSTAITLYAITRVSNKISQKA